LEADLSKNALDKVGIGLSLLCAVHCMIFPLLMVFSPWIGTFIEGSWFHIIMIVMVAPLALFLFIGTYKKHGNSRPLIFGSIGIAFLIVGLLVPELFEHDHGDHSLESQWLWIESILTTIGGGLLITAHFKNIKTCRCHHH
jgi:hypothetical protein